MKKTNLLHEAFFVMIAVSLSALSGGILVMGLSGGLLAELVSDLTTLSISAGVMAELNSSMLGHSEQWAAAAKLTILFSLIWFILSIILFNVTEPKDDHECPW